MLGSYIHDVLINMCCYVRQFRAAYLWCHWLISVSPPNSSAQPTKAQQEVVLALSSPALYLALLCEGAIVVKRQGLQDAAQNLVQCTM